MQLTSIVDFITTYKGKIYLRRLSVHFAEDCIENNTTMIDIDVTDLNGGGGIVNTNNLTTNRFINTFSYTIGYIYSGFSILKYLLYKSNTQHESIQDSLDTHGRRQRQCHYHIGNPFTHEK